MDENEQIQGVIESILTGYSRADILDNLAEEKAADPGAVFDAAMHAIERATNAEGDPVRAFHLGARQVLYQKNMEINDYKSAHHVLKDMAVISGVYKRVERAANLAALRSENGEE